MAATRAGGRGMRAVMLFRCDRRIRHAGEMRGKRDDHSVTDRHTRPGLVMIMKHSDMIDPVNQAADLTLAVSAVVNSKSIRATCIDKE